MAAARSGVHTPFLAFAMVLASAVLVSSCMGATISSGERGKDPSNASDVNLSFRVMGVDPAANTLASSAISRLILPTASTLTVSMKPLEAGLTAPADQTVAISSSPISVSFSDVEWGSYTVTAVASNGGGVAQFRQSATMTVSGTSSSATLNLVPASFDATTITGTDYSGSVSLSAGAMGAYAVPVSMLGDGTTGIPAGYYRFTCMSLGDPYTVYALDADGAIRLIGDVTGSTVTVIGGTSQNFGSYLYVGPCSFSSYSYLVFINKGMMGYPLTITLMNNAG